MRRRIQFNGTIEGPWAPAVNRARLSRDEERALLGILIFPTGGTRAAPAHGLCITTWKRFGGPLCLETTRTQAYLAIEPRYRPAEQRGILGHGLRGGERVGPVRGLDR